MTLKIVEKEHYIIDP